jgi:peptidoglycan hydrolase-like protein with peptidoglycan-binding domain
VNLTQQQRTTIQQTVLAGRNVPRVDNVNFALGVGTVVPTRVRIVDVPPALIEINPAWRGHQYFVVRDEIVIVDRSRKIVSVVPVGSSGGANLRGGAGGSTALNLSSDEIRQVQTVLRERGFSVEVDGTLGPRTNQAIIAFQRQQGFQTSGRIDNQTITALGLSNMRGAQGSTGAQGGATTGQGSGASTGGQSGAAQQQAPAQQNQGANQPHQNQGANQPSTSGQANQPSTSGQKASQPSTSDSSQAPQNKEMSPQPSAGEKGGANQPSSSGGSSK